MGNFHFIVTYTVVPTLNLTKLAMHRHIAIRTVSASVREVRGNVNKVQDQPDEPGKMEEE